MLGRLFGGKKNKQPKQPTNDADPSEIYAMALTASPASLDDDAIALFIEEHCDGAQVQPAPAANSLDARIIIGPSYAMMIVASSKPISGPAPLDPMLTEVHGTHQGFLNIRCTGGAAPGRVTQNMLLGYAMGSLAPADTLMMVSSLSPPFELSDAVRVAMLDGKSWVNMAGGIDILIDVRAGDAALAKTVETARAALPRFVEAFRAKTGQDFMIKAGFGDGNEAEHMWVQVKVISEELFVGLLASQPQYVSMQEGEMVHGKLADVEDWAFTEPGGRSVGYYSLAVLDKGVEAQLDPIRW